MSADGIGLNRNGSNWIGLDWKKSKSDRNVVFVVRVCRRMGFDRIETKQNRSRVCVRVRVCVCALAERIGSD